MNIISSYKVKIKDLNHCFSRTVEIYSNPEEYAALIGRW